MPHEGSVPSDLGLGPRVALVKNLLIPPRTGELKGCGLAPGGRSAPGPGPDILVTPTGCQPAALKCVRPSGGNQRILMSLSQNEPRQKRVQHEGSVPSHLGLGPRVAHVFGVARAQTRQNPLIPPHGRAHFRGAG